MPQFNLGKVRYFMDVLTLEICRPIRSHAQYVMQWRNDPHTLRMSYHGQPRQWSEFWTDFQAQFAPEAGRRHFFAVYRGQKAAYLRLDPCPHPERPDAACYEVSINVAPQFRGRGVGSGALNLAARAVEALGGDSLRAEVRVINEASLACFCKAGFRDLGRRIKHVADTGEDADIHVLVRDLHVSPGGEQD